MVQIEWTDEAEDDLDNILNYISKSSPQYAKTFFENVYDAVENLRRFPKMGRKVPESDILINREIILQNYRIIYRYFEETEKIIIKMIIHGSRALKL